MKTIVLYIILSFGCLAGLTQGSVLVSGVFPDYCRSSPYKNLYNIKVKISDTLTIESIIDTNYFQFNIPKFLIKNDVKIDVYKYSDNISAGTLCFPYIAACSSEIDAFLIPKDSLIYNSKINVKMTEGFRSISCGSLPSFQFELNSSNIDSVTLIFNAEPMPILLKKSQWDIHCICESLRSSSNVIVTANSDSGELNKSKLAKARGIAVKKLLKNYGIDEAKIMLHNKSDSMPVFNQTDINKLKAVTDKQMARKRNARVIVWPAN